MSKEDLILVDWEMTKDRIKHFDDMVIRIRLQSIPIATAIFAAGFVSLPYTKSIIVPCIGIRLASLIVALGSIYLIPIFFLDMLHYRLLTKAVDHALEIERQPKYKDKLRITTELTSKKLTWVHLATALFIYIATIATGFIMAFIISYVTLPP